MDRALENVNTALEKNPDRRYKNAQEMQLAIEDYLERLHAEYAGMRDGAVAGMLSVNAVTGAPWYHWWHGRFVAMSAGG